MGNEKDIISDEEITRVWENANFGSMSKRDVIGETLMKVASGYHSGHTAKCIVSELGLVQASKWELTKRGKAYLYAYYERINKSENSFRNLLSLVDAHYVFNFYKDGENYKIRISDVGISVRSEDFKEAIDKAYKSTNPI